MTTPPPPRMEPLRSMLFTPGNRHDLVAKAIASGTDAVIVDLEDAVAAEFKAEAREQLPELPSSPVPLYVRVNAGDVDTTFEDVIAAGRAGVAGVVVPKAEDPGLIREIAGILTAVERMDGRERGVTLIVPLIESAVGVRATYDLATASDRVECVMFGSGEQGDLVADLGVEWTPDGVGLNHARASVLLASRAAGIEQPMDAVFMDFRNLDALRVECLLARRMGYVGKVAIHPAQLAVIHEVFTPEPEVVAEQRRIVAEFDEALAEGKAAISIDGRMVDYAVIRVAHSIIGRAEAAERAADRARQEESSP